MARQEELKRLAATQLQGEGYECAQCGVWGGFFDIAARREQMLLVKVLEDINAFAAEQARSMHNAVAMLGGGCFVLGERAGAQRLREGVLYSRHEVDAGEFGTFGMLVQEGGVFVRKNRREYVKLDGRKLASARKEAGVSLRQLARLSGISKDTICRYEKNETMATESHAAELERIVNAGLRERVAGKVAGAAQFGFHGMAAALLAKPFELVAKEEEGEGRIVFGKESDRRTMRARAGVSLEFSRVSGAECCFIAESARQEEIFGVPIIRKSELDGIERAGELMKLVREKKGQGKCGF